MSKLFGLTLLVSCAFRTEAIGYHKYGLTVQCNENISEYSLIYNGEQIAYVNDVEGRPISTLPDFLGPVVIPDLDKDAQRSGTFCKRAIAVLNEAYVNPPDNLQPPWTSLYPRSEVVLSVKNTLICHVSGFFPPIIQVWWSRNNTVVTEGVYLSQYYHNSDGTLNVFSTLRFTPAQGDVYSCTVEHQALERPQTRIWEVEVNESSVLPSVLCGLGLAIGLLGVTAGVFFITKANRLCS